MPDVDGARSFRASSFFLRNCYLARRLALLVLLERAL
jgi:hypothetical protein